MREAEHLPPSGAEVKNKRTLHHSLSFLHGMNGGGLTLRWKPATRLHGVTSKTPTSTNIKISYTTYFAGYVLPDDSRMEDRHFRKVNK